MSRKIDETEFLRRFRFCFPDAKIEILEYASLKAKCIVKCAKCGKEFVGIAQNFLKSWNCCGEIEKIRQIQRACFQNGHYEFVKQLNSSVVIIKHLDCGNELKKNLQNFNFICFCPICQNNNQNLRSAAEANLDKNLQILFLKDEKAKAQFRCKNCGLIFYSTLDKAKNGCPKCRKLDKQNKLLDSTTIFAKESTS